MYECLWSVRCEQSRDDLSQDFITFDKIFDKNIQSPNFRLSEKLRRTKLISFEKKWNLNRFQKVLLHTILIFFAAYIICKKNFSFSRVVFLFFSDQICQLFLFKNKTAVGLGQQGSQAVGSGFESLSCQIFFWLIHNIFRYLKLVKH